MKEAVKELKASVLLQEVLKSLKNPQRDDSQFICCLVSKAARILRGNYLHPKAVLIREQIAADLQGLHTYDTWLRNKHCLRLTQEQMREARLQWVKALITYYQQQGD